MLCREKDDLAIQLVSALNTKFFDLNGVEELVAEVLYNPELMHQYYQGRKAIIQSKMQNCIDSQKALLMKAPGKLVMSRLHMEKLLKLVLI